MRWVASATIRSCKQWRDWLGPRLAWALLGAAATGWPLAGFAQQTAKPARIVLLSDHVWGRFSSERAAPFRQRLRELGWVEGKNIVFEERHAATEEQRKQIAAEMERLPPEVIYACPPCSLQAGPSGRAPIRGVPIVFMYSDPVGAKMVKSLAHPGGNLTGFAFQGQDLDAKRLQLLKELIPALVRVGVLVMKNHLQRDRMVADLQVAASKLNVTLQLFEIAGDEPAERIDAAFEAMSRDGTQAVLGLTGAHFSREHQRIAGLVLKYRLPGIFSAGPRVEIGALMTYDANFLDLTRRMAGLVDKILKGAKPSEIPIEQPNSFEFAINLGIAKKIGLKIPQSILLRADRVIE